MSQEQEELFDPQTPEEALSADVRALGGPHIVGKKLRPELDKTAARNWLLNCLNPEHKQNLTQSQIRLLVNLARERDSAHYIRFWSADNSMTEPELITPESEKEKLQREVMAAMSDFKDLVAKAERLLK